MHIAVTGGTGFIGSHMLAGLARAGHELRVLVLYGCEADLRPPPGARCEVHLGDLTRGETLAGFLEGADALVHMASAHGHFPEEVLQRVNVRGTEHLLEEAARSAPPGFRLLLLSSAAIGSPVQSRYSDSKREQERIIRESGIDWVSLRPTLVYGVGDERHTGPLLRKCALARGTFWVPHEGRSLISPVHVEDAVDAVVRCLEPRRRTGRVYELAGPRGMAFNEYIDVTIAAAGGGIRRRNVPRRWVEWVIAVKGMFSDVTRHRQASAYFARDHEGDIRAAVEELGWRPRSYAEGIEEVAGGDWWRGGG